MHVHEKGMTLIDTVIGSALLLLIFVGVGAAFQLSVDVVTNDKARAGAIALANERMEYIRSLSYDQIGTVNGIPSGNIAQSETVTLNSQDYTRRTTVEYADDPGDGTGTSDTNSITVDYKAVRVDVAWTSRLGDRHITLVTRIEPPNGMEVACSSPCGTLALVVNDASGQPLSNAQVRVVNASTTPAVDLTTYTDVNGKVNLLGAAVGSGYAVTVTKLGYSTAQTYSSTAQNPNPTPGHLTVSQNQTTSATFAIDTLATKTVYTFTAIATSTWSDTFSDSTKVATSTNIDVTGGAARLSGAAPYPSHGELQSIAIGPSYLVHWTTFSLTRTLPAGTTLTYHFYDGSGVALIPDSQLPGNSAGFSGSSVDLSGVSTSTYPAIRVDFTLGSSGDATPSLDSYSILHDAGGAPLPNISFFMQGAKTTGSGPPVLYKYAATSTTSAQGGVTLSNVEWDTYTVTIPSTSGYDIVSACNPQPEYLPPGSTAGSRFFLAPHATNVLLVEVRTGGALLANATTTLTKTGYAATTTTDGCGQAYFSYLAAGTYTLGVTSPGLQPYSNAGTAVSGATRVQVSLSP